MADKLEDFTKIVQLGAGSFGKVYKMQKTSGANAGAMYAAKEMKKCEIYLPGVKTEISILKQCAHPFVLKLAFEFETEEKMYIFTEEMHCSIFDILQYLKKFTEEETRYFLNEIVAGVEYLHENRIIHRDLKPENILISSLGHIKIADFGVAEMDYDNLHMLDDICGSFDYMAPEMVMEMGYDNAVDWWAVGAVTYQMLTGYMPFYADNLDGVIANIINCNYPALPAELSEDSKSLVERFLTLDPEQRLGYDGAEEVMQHKFFKNSDWKDSAYPSVELPIRIRNYLFGKREMDTSSKTNTFESFASRFKKNFIKYFC